jgi:hypothetical protein
MSQVGRLREVRLRIYQCLSAVEVVEVPVFECLCNSCSHVTRKTVMFVRHVDTCHAPAAPMPRCAMALRSRFQNGMVVAWHGRGMGAALERHGMCELALRIRRLNA